MDTELINEVSRLQRVYDEMGLYAFTCECQDFTLASERNWWPRSPLFALSSPDGTLRMRRDGKLVGNPFSIRRSETYQDPVLFAWTDEWTDAIRNDNRIPSHEARMLPEKLWVLAEWQQTFRDYFRGRRSFVTQRIRKHKAMLRYSAGA